MPNKREIWLFREVPSCSTQLLTARTVYPDVTISGCHCSANATVRKVFRHTAYTRCASYSQVHLGLLCASGALDLLEMFVLNNTSVRPMGLGLDALEELLETADNLSYVGNLRTWSRIDHYDPDSPQYFKCESRLSQLKRVAVEKNWDIDFDIEELEFSK